MMNEQQKLEMVVNFLIRFNESGVTEDEHLAFKRQLEEDPQILQYYAEIATMLSQFHAKEFKPEIFNEEELNFDSSLWRQLAESEKTAPHKEVVKPTPQRELIQKLNRKKLTYRFKKSSVLSLVAIAATVLFIILFERFVPSKPGPQVATLSDSIQAAWASDDEFLVNGVRLATGSRCYTLEEGLVELVFDDDAKVVIQAPSDFRILADDEIELNYGRLYAVVPHEVSGFTVKTENSKIVDLGTEFGVYAIEEGHVEFHVTKGATRLIADPASENNGQLLTEGFARKVSSKQTITDIPCAGETFVQRINSQQNLIWNGQMSLDIADIATGGNGLGTATKQTFLNPLTGHFENLSSTQLQQGQKKPLALTNTAGTGDYVSVKNHAFIDGVFVPDSKNRQIQITSQKHIFTKTESANGTFTEGFINSMDENASLYMHANLGITFDLNKIRQTYSHLTLDSFKAICGNTDPSASNENTGSADFFILIDGMQQCHQIENVQAGQHIPIEINIQNNDQFLTLITVGNKNEFEQARTFFAIPKFIMNSKQ